MLISTLQGQSCTLKREPLKGTPSNANVCTRSDSTEDGNFVKQIIWYADDATVCGGLKELQLWWDKLASVGLDYGYFPNPSKTCVIVKERMHDAAVFVFQGTGISITSDGKLHLGAALGSLSFVASFVERQVKSWINELQRLSNISVTHPQAAYAAFTQLHMNLLANRIF